MKITRISIKNYRGIAELSAEVPGQGLLVAGDNEVGKTSFLKAVRAALEADGCDPGDIRNGADAAEIVVDMDAVTVRRRIGRKATDVTVTTAEGDRWARPTTRLREMLGTSSIDALDFFLAKAPERREILTKAMPVEVTPEDVQRWTDSACSWMGPVTGHGLLVLDLLTKHFTEERRKANAETKTRKDAAATARASASEKAGDIAAAPASVLDAKVKAREAHNAARAAVDRQAAAKESEEKAAGKRTEAADLRAGCTRYGNAREARRAQDDQRQRIAELENTLRLKRQDLEIIDGEVSRHEQADAIETALAATAAVVVSDAEVEKARAVATAAAQAVESAERDVTARELAAEAARLEALADEAVRPAVALDVIVKRLTNEVPAELATRAQMIQGLAIDGETISLDGVAIDRLNSAKQMAVAVEIAKRANARSKILIVDGLERVAPARMKDFLALATADGWQVLASRVQDGAMVVEAIEA